MSATEKEKVKPVDYTGKKPGPKRIKNFVRVEYLEHSSLTKTTKGINPGDKAWIGKKMAERLVKEKKVKILAD